MLVRAAWPRPVLPPLAHYPRVSILVAARNEAAIIERCLVALKNHVIDHLLKLIDIEAHVNWLLGRR